MLDHKAPYQPYTAAVTIVILVVILLFFIATILLLLHKDYRLFPVQKLAANSMIAHFVFSIILHPTSIHLFLLYRPVSKAMCWIYRHIFLCYLLVTPYALFMFTIERLIYIRNPTAHAQKFGRVAIAVMLALPWVISLLTAIIMFNFYPHEIYTQSASSREWDFNETMHTCYMKSTRDAQIIQMIVLGLIGAVVPFLTGIIIAIVALCMWCCYKRKHSLGTNYSLMGEQVEVAVRDSVIAGSLLNFLYVFVLFSEMATASFFLPLRHASVTLYGFAQGIILLGTLGDVRKKIREYWMWCSRRRMENSSVQYVAKEEENMDL